MMFRTVITLLFCVETFSRGLLLAIIPLKVLAFAGSMQGVALFYAAVAILGLGNSILIPKLLSRFGSRFVVAAAGSLIVSGVALLATDTIFGTALGLAIRVFAQSCLEISMLAYIMARYSRPAWSLRTSSNFLPGRRISDLPLAGLSAKREGEPLEPVLCCCQRWTDHRMPSSDCVAVSPA